MTQFALHASGTAMTRRAFGVGLAGILVLQRSANVAAGSRLSSAPQPHEPSSVTPEAVDEGNTVDADIRDVLARPWKYEDQLVRFRGTVEEMRVAPDGQGFPVGNEEDGTTLFRTQMVMDADLPDGETENILVVSDTDPEEVHKDVYIEVVATFGGTHIEDARGGGYWEWPFFVGRSVEPTIEPER